MSDPVSLPQCRTVKITILGDEGVPVQVDGEAWIQPPGYIKIIHKNRTQTLTRDRVSTAAGCGILGNNPGELSRGQSWGLFLGGFPGV